MRTSWSLLALLALVTAVCVARNDCNCRKDIAKYYSELGCRPIKKSGACCPYKYDCPAALRLRSKEKCYLRGKTYDPGAEISESETGNPCAVSCRCTDLASTMRFMCAFGECRAQFFEQKPDGCVSLYSHDQCCSTGKYCANATSPTAKESAKCQYGGETYVLGEQFFPKEEPCKTCICQKGFDGTLKGPWCREFSCGYELQYGSYIIDGCAPTFFGTNGCCPIEWRCPSNKDTVVPVATNKKRISSFAGKCSFGSLQLNVGDSLSKEKTCVECSCVVPPHVTCVQKGYC